jgi:agmatinase
MTEAYQDLGTRIAARSVAAKPKLITLGGDHSIALPALRALNAIYREPIAVVHFDAHLDTWHPAKYPSAWLDDYDDGSSNMGGEGSPNHITDPSFFNHGSMFWLAHREGLLANGSLVHAGLRTRLSGIADLTDDDVQGWERISADEMDECGGAASIIDRILRRVESGSDGGRETPVYLSVDIDVLDPGLAPGTGTPEPGGWTTRELIRVLRGIERLNVVGADVVEVSPAYDGPGEATALAAAQVVYEILTSMVIKGKKVVEEHKLKDEL